MENKFHSLSLEDLSFDELRVILNENLSLKLGDQMRQAIKDGKEFLDKKIKENKRPLYGINTGFGALQNTTISPENLDALQRNLILSHACGTGEEIPQELVKLMLLLKIRSLGYGHSGVSLELAERLIYLYNNDILPVVYTQGSLGASGDLIPLAHLTLPLLGMGEAYFKGKKTPASEILKQIQWNAYALEPKEGLAMLNGTQFMSAYGIYILLHASELLRKADMIAAISLDAFHCRREPFHELLHHVRPHFGQISTAEYIREILEGSEINDENNSNVQDAYSFRCIPQVHGAVKDAVNSAAATFHTEMNSVTDNPTLFPEEDEILSGGNFHGEPLALSLDYIAMALAELGNISERRTFQLLSGQRGLPVFLAKNPGLHSGLMMAQYLAAAIVSENKTLCMPASADSITSSNGQEDHVSMGANAAVKCLKVFRNLETIIAVELLTSAQALEMRRPMKSSPKIESLLADYRKVVPFINEDRVLRDDVLKSVEFLQKSAPVL